MSILENLIGRLKGLCRGLVDPRIASPNLQYPIVDVGLSAFSLFFTQSPSFLSYQRHLERSHGTSNAQSLFGVEKIPTDNQIRKLLDETPADHFFPLFRDGFETFSRHPGFEQFKVMGNRILIPLDATQTHSSHKISCPSCTVKHFEKKPKKGSLESVEGVEHYSHSFVGACLCQWHSVKQFYK